VNLLVQTHVARAAHEVVSAWPIESFIAVNPLAAQEGVRFADVREPGVSLTLTPPQYRAALAAGRITHADLVAAVHERVGEVAGLSPIDIGGMPRAASEILVGDMLATDPLSPPTATGPSPDPLERYVTPWVAAFLDPDPQWPMPGRERGLYSAWRALAVHDPHLTREARRRVALLPDRALPALSACLAHLGIAEAETVRALTDELRALPGWAGYVKWRGERSGDIDLTEYLAVRLALRHGLGLAAAPPADDRGAPHEDDMWVRAEKLAAGLSGSAARRADVAALARVLALHPSGEHLFTWQAAYEGHYRTALLRVLDAVASPADGSVSPTGSTARRPDAQVVMCIDPRSEGVRRHLEADPGIETLGFAGFFGVPIRFAPYGGRGAVDSLPALVRPRHTVTEAPAAPARARRRTRGLRALDAAAHALHTAENATATPLALAETTGWAFGVASLTRTVAPTLHRTVTQRWRRLVAPPSPSEVTVTDAFTLDERVTFAEAALRTMGLDRFARLVVLTGHGSTSTNNLYQAALDCGACGGNPGAANARAAAAIFNDPAVRDRLDARGLAIPDDTVFVAALHDTVADTVTVLDTHLIPGSHTAEAAAFTARAAEAADRLVRERAADLPGAHARQSLNRLRSRAHDWAEVYPELGLAGNAAMIVGPREMTAGIDLGRRVFLHSYRAEVDPSGAGLETILTAPLIVAQWINHQYYFSSLNPDTLGAGTKTIHNAIGGIGVLSGHGGDLRRGLPWQSVAVGDTLLHEPLRLSVLVQAPLERIGEIVSGNQVLRHLLDNDWITLTARDAPHSPWFRHTPYGWSRTSRHTDETETL